MPFGGSRALILMAGDDEAPLGGRGSSVATNAALEGARERKNLIGHQGVVELFADLGI